MPKDYFEFDNELEELEKEMGSKFENLGQSPLRTEFKEELRHKIEKRIETEEQGKTSSRGRFSLKKLFNFGFGRRKWQAGISIAMVVVLLAGVFWGMGGMEMFVKPAEASEISIVAMEADGMGVDVDSAFLLSSPQPLDKKTVQDALKTEPEFAYSLDKMEGGKQYKIIPQEELKPNTVYTLSFDQDGSARESMSWAFQTKGKFRVIRSLPADMTTHVPVNSGIEITFSHDNFDLNAVKQYFSISPAVEGSFEKHKKTLVFVPKALQPSTIYTVTLKKGLTLSGTEETLNEDFSFSFETAAKEAQEEPFVMNLDSGLTEFSTADRPVFPVYIYSDNTNLNQLDVHIDLYRYPNHQEFKNSLVQRNQIPRWSYISWNQYKEKMNPAYKVAGYDIKILTADQYNHYIAFPENLQAGYYAAEVTMKGAVRQVWFQVSDLSVYLSQGTNQGMFWINDLKTKKPAAGAEISIENKGISVKTDQSGVALVEAGLFGEKTDYALVRSGDQEILVPLESNQYWYQTTPNAMDYWKYLYLDRELYKPGDTINFWGVLSARSQNAAPLKEARIELWGTDGPYYLGAEAAPILTQQLDIKGKTFTGQLKLPVLKPGYYYVQIKTGDISLLSRGFSVETYQKPSYKLSLTQDKKAVFIGEQVNFLAQTSFFEGTPVPGLKLDYHYEDKKGSVITDSTGEAKISCLASLPYESYNPYSYVYVGVNAQLPEAGEIYNFGEFYVFKSKVYLTGEAKRTADGFTLNAKLSEVDLTDINNGQYIAEEHFLKGPVAGSSVKASLYQEIWTPVEAGKRYDFISKQVVTIYNHEYSVKHLEDFELTSGADGTISLSKQADPQSSYYLELTARDSEGRPFTRRIQVGGMYSTSPDYQYYYLQTQGGNNGFLPGEEAKVTFMVNDRELTVNSGSILYYRGQNTIEAAEVTDSSQYAFTFSEKNIPNVNVYGVYFDGSSYYEASPVSVAFAQKTKALNVRLESDKSEYRPGEKVKLSLQVTDSNNQPVKDAEVNLNLVDEALFSLRDQNVNFLGSLYNDHFGLFQVTWKSHNHPFNLGGAEKGGEGAGERKDFRDTVLFTTVKTNGSGQASVEFTLPDNLTSWRVTYHAFTEDLQAGSGSEQIPVTLPFFVEMIHNTVYLEGDSPTVMLRAFGEKLAGGQAVSYQVKLIGPDGKEITNTLNGEAFKTTDWKLPKLEAGKYTLKATAKSGNFQDSLSKDFTVQKSMQERTVTSSDLLSADLQLNGSPEQPTDLIFCDYEKSQYIRGLYQLAWNNGSRLEQKLAAREAGKLLKQYFPDEPYFAIEEEDSLLVYQQQDGGISILPYAESELQLTAMVAAATTGVFDANALAAYFYRILEGNPYEQNPEQYVLKEDDKSLALLGLASLKQPVLLEINNFLKQENLEPAVKINLALALLEIGDGAYAGKVYRELMDQYAEDLGAVTRINLGATADQDDIIAATSQMALLASRLDQPEKHELYQYLLENPGKDILTSLEQLQILKSNLQYMKSNPVSFTYELNGSKVSKTLESRDIFKLTLLPEDLQRIRFSQIEGKVGVVSKYAEAVKPGETGKAADLKISRFYAVGGTQVSSLDRTKLVKVVISYEIGDQAPNGIYEVVDILPAGLSYVSYPYRYDEKPDVYWNYPSEVKGQKVTFLVSKDKDRNQISYLARVNSPGEYRCEAPLLSNLKNSVVYSSGAESRIEIK